MRLVTGLHDLISMDCIGFDRDGDAYITLRQRGIHDRNAVEGQVSFCFKDVEQMERLRDWLNTRIDEAGKAGIDEV